MSRSNKFGFAPLDTEATAPRRTRSPGPMGTAVRDAAETLADTTEAKVEQRRQNAEDARNYRMAQDSGRLLVGLPVGNVLTDDLPRDRLALDEVAASDEMEELKSSIRARGQKEPIEVYQADDGSYQLKKGWRRLTALRQLLAETGEDRFAEVIARVENGAADRTLRYVDMVEENVVREDLTFAEMAQVAITAAADPGVPETDPAELVARLYGALHKTKRSYIRSFVFLLTALGDDLKWPKAVARNLGVDVARALKSIEQADALRAQLTACASEEQQAKVLADFVVGQKSGAGAADTEGKSGAAPRQKLEFFVGETKVTARNGELRVVSGIDFANTPKAALEDAIKAFEAALKTGPRIR
ncbi:ParB N-terminal domain-containing protein [uncultured Tateyamaria sp.]|uniref:ParB/RepB/Spo0J family partition protein n=1 Tax=Tateyamaria sp. 1078 TaxID=3417464 RepID=UPI00263029F0|nr:ParB N-terminal domain-containing protein [uncultured Tateyamaria sp.]